MAWVSGIVIGKFVWVQWFASVERVKGGIGMSLRGCCHDAEW